MSCNKPSSRWPTWCGLALLAAALLRLGLMVRVALTDNTESRYGNIGWLMYSSGDWITPRIYIDGELVPFWGKPPLQFWLTALSYRTFGVSEWAARVPSFLIALAIVAATVVFASRFWGRRAACLAGVLLTTSGLFFALAGACVLDVPLAGSISAAMIAFALFAQGSGRRRAWGLAMFVALGFGALAKGPIALVLVGLAIGIWLVLVRRWKLVAELPWLWGLVLFLAVASPWHLLAERATPGFLRYFLIHEHLLRYVSNDYGDKYGAGRTQPYGAVWLMLVGALLPWTVLAVAALTRWFRGRKVLDVLRGDPMLTYVLVWGLAPPLFFTLARQLLVTYLLPGLPGLAIAAAVGLDRWIDSEAEPTLLKWLKWHFVALGLLAAVGAVAAVACGLSLLLAAAVLAPIAVLGWFARTSHRLGDSATVATIFGLATTATFGAAALVFAPMMDEHFSAKTVLARLYEIPGAIDRPIVMPRWESGSASFYVEAVFEGRFEHRPADGLKLMRTLLDDPHDEVLLFKRKDWNRLAEKNPELTARCVPVIETAHWVACEGRRERPSGASQGPSIR